MHTLTTGLAIGESPRWHDGRLWLSDMGAGEVVAVDAAGRREVVAAVPAMPMGTGWLPDGGTLIVAESYAHRLTAFDVAGDGSLANRRVWADLGETAAPDGICLDAEGAVWYADVPNRRCVRVREGGAVAQTVELDRGCF